MPSWLGRALPVVVPILAVSVGGVVLGGLVKWAFGVPDDVAAKVGGVIAVAAFVLSLTVALYRIYRNRRAR
jgi:hypothetical protein